MRVRQARIEDARAIAEVQVGTWQSAYRGIVDQAYLDLLSVEDRAEQWQRTLRGEELSQRHGGPIRVAVTEIDAGAVDGFVAWCQCRKREGDDAKAETEVLAIYVMEEVQGQGRGRALFDSVWSSEEPKVALIARTLEAGAARAFYESLGGVVCERGECRVGDKGYPSVCYRIAPAGGDTPVP